jgi:hypothetical protein
MSEQLPLPLPMVDDPANTLINETLLAFPVDSELNTPPKTLTRNKYGLLDGVKYVFNEDGTVNWKAMVEPKYLYINPDSRRRQKIEAKYGKKFEEINIIDDKVDDTDLVIQLGGLKKLLQLRGFRDLRYDIHQADPTYAAVTCSIEFVENYECQNRVFYYSDNACAHPENTTNFGKQYLLEIATNRALCRCIRNALGINIVAQEELSGISNPDGPEDMAVSTLKQVMSQHNYEFEDVIKMLVEENYENAQNLKRLNELPKPKIFELISRIKSNPK